MSNRSLHVFASTIETESRLLKEAHYTLESNIFDEVTVIGLWKNGLPQSESTNRGLKIIRKRTLVRRFQPNTRFLRLLLRALGILEYFFAVFIWSVRKRPTHVSCHSVAMLPIAWLAKCVCGAVLVYVPHELETRRSRLAGFGLKFQSWIERFFIRAARDIVVVCEPIAEWYRNTYELETVHVVRNVPECSAVKVEPRKRQAGFRAQFEIPDSAVVYIYQGLFAEERGTYLLLDHFQASDPQKAQLVLMGYGEKSVESAIKSNCERYPNIHFQQAVPMHKIVSYTSGADVGIFVTQDESISYNFALPNKFFEFCHAGLACIVSENMSLQAETVEKNGLGWAVKADEIGKTIENITLLDLEKPKQAARKFAQTAIWENDAEIYHHVYR